MLPAIARKYLIIALEGTPQVLGALLDSLETEDERWDLRPDPERFTLREIVAHLASVEPNWTQRALRIRDENQPVFDSVPLQDEAIGRNNPADNLVFLRENRLQFVNVLKGLQEEDWEKTGESQTMGIITLEQQAVFVLTHDGYHTSQVVQWLKQAP